MKPLILLIHTQAHVDALPETARTIISAGFDRCWVIISPAIAVNAKDATEKLDGEIASLKAAQDAAAAREDYEAAAGHKLAREGKVLDRDKAIADAWKSVPEEDRKVAYRAKLTPLFEAFKDKVNGRTSVTQEHYAPAQWIQMLNSLSGVWPKELVHGEYVVAWPGAIPKIVRISLPKDEAETPTSEVIAAAQKVQERLPKIPAPLSTRHSELQNMHGMKRRALATSLGIDLEGKDVPAIIEAIIAKETEAAVAAL